MPLIKDGHDLHPRNIPHLRSSASHHEVMYIFAGHRAIECNEFVSNTPAIQVRGNPSWMDLLLVYEVSPSLCSAV